MNKRPFRPPFDPKREYVATPRGGRPLAVGGTQLQFGERLDKALVTPRRLRQMYENRFIALDPTPTRAPAHEPASKVVRRAPLKRSA